MTATRSPEADGRYSTPIEASRRGAHRARPKPVTTGLPVVAGIAVLFLVFGGGYAVLKNDSGEDGGKVAAAVNLDDDPTASAGASPRASTPASTAASTPVAPRSTAPATPAQDPATTKPVTDVDRSVNLRVLNSTGIKGLATRVQDSVESDGWTVKGTGNSRNRNLPVTKIYYGGDSTRATAEALRDDLGYGTIVLDRSALRTSGVTTSGLVVVLGADAT